jgi:hypothetical protein
MWRSINEYLIDGAPVAITKRMQPLSPSVPPVSMGRRPRDDGQLIIEEADYHLVENDPVAMRYVRPLRGNRELLHNKNHCASLVE